MATGPVGFRETGDDQTVLPVSIQGGWNELTVAPEAADTNYLNPWHADFTARWQKVKGTQLLLQLGYDDGDASSAQCVVVVHGRDATTAEVTAGTTPTCHKLKDAVDAVDITLTYDETNDLTDGTLNYTTPKAVDMDGAKEVLVTVKTAYNGTTTTNSIILVKAI